MTGSSPNSHIAPVRHAKIYFPLLRPFAALIVSHMRTNVNLAWLECTCWSPSTELRVRIIQVFTFNYASYPHNLSFAALEREILVEDDLSDIGLVVNLGHGTDICPTPLCTIRDMHVIDTNGIFTTKVRFCNCPGTGAAANHYIQVLRNSWFRARSKSEFRCHVQMSRLCLPSEQPRKIDRLRLLPEPDPRCRLCWTRPPKGA